MQKQITNHRFFIHNDIFFDAITRHCPELSGKNATIVANILATMENTKWHKHHNNADTESDSQFKNHVSVISEKYARNIAMHLLKNKVIAGLEGSFELAMAAVAYDPIHLNVSAHKEQDAASGILSYASASVTDDDTEQKQVEELLTGYCTTNSGNLDINLARNVMAHLNKIASILKQPGIFKKISLHQVISGKATIVTKITLALLERTSKLYHNITKAPGIYIGMTLGGALGLNLANHHFSGILGVFTLPFMILGGGVFGSALITSFTSFTSNVTSQRNENYNKNSKHAKSHAQETDQSREVEAKAARHEHHKPRSILSPDLQNAAKNIVKGITNETNQETIEESHTKRQNHSKGKTTRQL